MQHYDNPEWQRRLLRRRCRHHLAGIACQIVQSPLRSATAGSCET
jgi:hypothetical protein